MNMENTSVRRWTQRLNRAMPVVLDTSGVILLSGSAMTFSLTAGLAAAGVGCFALNWRFNEGKRSSH